jgi:hypothetical protein
MWRILGITYYDFHRNDFIRLQDQTYRPSQCIRTFEIVRRVNVCWTFNTLQTKLQSTGILREIMLYIKSSRLGRSNQGGWERREKNTIGRDEKNKTLDGKSQGRDYSDYLDANGKIVLKWILEK